LWRRETEGKLFDSPERKAALDKSLREALLQIRDRSLRAHYGDEIKALRQALFQAGRGGPGQVRRGSWKGGKFNPPPARALPGTLNSYLAKGGEAAEERLREAVILAVLLKNPAIIEQFLSALENLELVTPEHRAIQAALLRHMSAPVDEIWDRVQADTGSGALEKLMSPSHLRIIPMIGSPGDNEAAALCVAQELAKLEAFRGAEREIADAALDLDALPDEGVTWRLGQVAAARNQALESRTDDDTEYERGENGAAVSREERSAFEQLLQKIEYGKGRKKTH
jgi:DNA primase